MIEYSSPEMERIDDNDFTVVTMGTFDGIHLGHQKLLRKVIARARKNNGKSVVITYYHHPKETFNENLGAYLLTEKERKTEILTRFGIDIVAYLRFDRKMALLKAEDFIRDILVDKFKAKEIVFGYDCHFGHKREGNYKFLKEREQNYGYRSFMINPVKLDHQIVSSSLIRNMIRDGQAKKAAKFLGRNYDIYGTVEDGEKVGRHLGFPTINIRPSDHLKLLPGKGVYLGRVFFDEKTFFCLTNVGYCPTIKQLKEKIVESYIIDYDGDLYKRDVRVEFIQKIRDEKDFSGQEALRGAIRNDIMIARSYIERQNSRKE
jgi:riboflavin kinase / FMN adenylyltransferase